MLLNIWTPIDNKRKNIIIIHPKDMAPFMMSMDTYSIVLLDIIAIPHFFILHETTDKMTRSLYGYSKYSSLVYQCFGKCGKCSWTMSLNSQMQSVGVSLEDILPDIVSSSEQNRLLKLPFKQSKSVLDLINYSIHSIPCPRRFGFSLLPYISPR